MRSYFLILSVLLGLSSVVHATEFGFDYWPRGFSGDIFFDTNWVNHKSDVIHDLDVIQSMGGTTLRLMFWPEQSGFELDPKLNAISPQYLQMVKNFPEFLELLSERHMRVILCFSNSFLLYGPDSPNATKWWNLKYGGHENLNAFLIDSGRWISGLVQSSEESPYASSVLYYDIQNEYTPSWPDMNSYVGAMAKLPIIPKNKLGISILYGASDVATIKDLASAQQLDFRFVDFHIYPDTNANEAGNTATGFNMNLEEIHHNLKMNFPGARFLIGELGYRASSIDQQAAQSNAMISILNRASSDNIEYVLGWSLYDDAGQSKMQMSSGTGVFDSAGLPKQIIHDLQARMPH